MTLRRLLVALAVILAALITLVIATADSPLTLKYLLQHEAGRPHFNPNEAEALRP